MEIEQVFQPITITLESYEEAATLTALLYPIYGAGSSRKICDALYCALENKGIKSKLLHGDKFAGEQPATVFQPIIITLKSYEEAATLMALVGSKYRAVPSRHICDALYCALDNKGITAKLLHGDKFDGE